MARLLAFAIENTKAKPHKVRDFGDLGARLNASAQTVHNWKKRGLSKEGALAAEREFGCSADWLLHGNGQRVVAVSPPPPPPPRFADRHEVSDSDFATLLAVKLVLTESELDAIRERARKVEALAERLIAERGNEDKP